MKFTFFSCFLLLTILQCCNCQCPDGVKAKFGGYVSNHASCKKICKRHYGLNDCLGFVFEKKNQGKCTIFYSAPATTTSTVLSPFFTMTTPRPSSMLPFTTTSTRSFFTTATSFTKRPNCCSKLIQSVTNYKLADGTMSFKYDNEICRTSGTVTCVAPQNIEIVAMLIVNESNFMDFGWGKISFPVTCNDGIWKIGSPPLNVNKLECLNTDPV